MLTIFKRIRKSLLGQGFTSKYFFYAIGEIALIVIGILIALKIGDYNTSKKNQRIEEHYISTLVDEVELDSVRLSRLVGDRMQRKISVLEQAKEYVKGNYRIGDTISFLNNIGYGGVFSRANTFKHSPTFDELLYTGNIKLISDDWVRSGIMNYYESQNLSERYTNNIRSEYSTFTGSLMPYDQSNPAYIDSTDFKWIIKSLNNSEFRTLINEELNFGYATKDRAERLLHSVNNLLNRMRTQYPDL